MPEKKTEKAKTRKKSQKPRKAIREEGLSNDEKWLKAFERDLEKDQ